MKKILSVLLTFIGINVSAQVMPDSTVQFVANWSAGDRFKYSFDKLEYKVTDTDTTYIEQMNEIIEFEVMEATETSYKLKLSSLEYTSSDESQNVLSKLYADKFGTQELILNTNQFGQFQSCDNSAELVAQMKELIEPTIGILGKFPKKERQAIIDYMMQMYDSPDFINALLAPYVILFNFHGTRLEIGKEYSGVVEAPSFIPNVQTMIPLNTSISVKPDNVTEDYAIPFLRKYSEGDTLTIAIMEAIEGMLSSASISEEDAKTLLEELLACDFSLSESEATQIHFATGVPLYHFYQKVISGKDNGKFIQKVEERSFQYVVE